MKKWYWLYLLNIAVFFQIYEVKNGIIDWLSIFIAALKESDINLIIFNYINEF